MHAQPTTLRRSLHWYLVRFSSLMKTQITILFFPESWSHHFRGQDFFRLIWGMLQPTDPVGLYWCEFSRGCFGRTEMPFLCWEHMEHWSNLLENPEGWRGEIPCKLWRNQWRT